MKQHAGGLVAIRSPCQFPPNAGLPRDLFSRWVNRRYYQFVPWGEYKNARS